MLDLARLLKAVPFTSMVLVWGTGVAHQPVYRVPFVGVAVFIDDGLQPQGVGIAHHRLRWVQEGHQAAAGHLQSRSHACSADAAAGPSRCPRLVHPGCPCALFRRQLGAVKPQHPDPGGPEACSAEGGRDEGALNESQSQPGSPSLALILALAGWIPPIFLH